MSVFVPLVGKVFLVIGFLFVAVAAVGVLRLPDLYCRAHALGKAMTLGIICFLIALGCLVEDVAWWKIVVAIVFQFVTIPVASHLMCLVAYRCRVGRWSAKGWVAGEPSAGRGDPDPR